MSAERLFEAAERFRANAALATKATVNMPMVNGVWLNLAHYLTTTAPSRIAPADWLDETGQRWDWVEERDLALNFANTILGDPK